MIFILVTGTTQPEHEVLQRQEQPISAVLRTKQVSLLKGRGRGRISCDRAVSGLAFQKTSPDDPIG